MTWRRREVDRKLICGGIYRKPIPSNGRRTTACWVGWDRSNRKVGKDPFAVAMSMLIFFVFFVFFAFFGSAPAYGSNAVNSYAASVFQLLEKHRHAVPRLFDPANATANALIQGGAFYLGGDKGWVAEGDGRAGGLMMVRPLSASNPPAKGDVVWLAYSAESYEQEAERAKELEGRGCLVIAFGPKLASGTPHFSYWIDSFTPPTAAPNFTLMGNIISLWTLTAEVTASVSRQGKTLTFFQSDSVEGSRLRNSLYGLVPPPGVWKSKAEKRGLVFHTGVPQMAPVQPGVLSYEYLDYVQEMLENIQEWELPKIIMVGQQMSRQAAEGHPAALMLIGHMMPFAVDHHSRLFRYLNLHTERSDLQSHLQRGGYFVLIGYVGVYLDLWREVRGADATAVWIVSTLPTEVHFSQWGDVVIDQHWRIGDCAVEVPGYDIRILPPSGIAQLFIYETLIRAAESQ